MVNVANRRSRGASSSNIMSIGVASVLALIGMAAWYNNFASLQSVTDLASLSALSEAVQASGISLIGTTDMGAAQLKKWRKALIKACEDAKSLEDVEALSRINKSLFSLPTTSSRIEQPRDERAVRQCKRIVLDFGANIGDTSGKVIDAGLVGCKRDDLKKELTGPVFNTETRIFEDAKNNRRNPLVRNFKHLMESFGPLTGPEDYCYYGVEGNPVFVDRLQSLEDFIMGIHPRPLKHIHFFTLAVGAGEDGMTKLYLDTVNTKENFWGSSIFKGHQDVQKSATAQNTTAELVAADVMGYTIGSLMRKTLIAFDPEASPEEKTGGHFILKVDIEGGEFPLLAQAAEEGTLCEYTKMGNQADLYIEFHSQRVTGSNPLFGKMKGHRQKLTDCGVTFRKIQAWWA